MADKSLDPLLENSSKDKEIANYVEDYTIKTPSLSQRKKTHNRSATGKKKKNQRTKNRQRVNKQKLKMHLELKRKDEVIVKLSNELKTIQSKSKAANFSRLKLSSVCTRTVKASNHVKHQNLTESRDFIIQKQEGIPKIPIDNYQAINFSVGSGVFGTVKLGKILTMNVTVAEKQFDKKTSRKALLAEVIILMSLSGNKFVPFCFGLLDSNAILMEFLGDIENDNYHPHPTLAALRKRGELNVNSLKYICRSILQGVIFIHSKGILHNDIKADNVIVAGKRVVLIDFGKASMKKCPVFYSLNASEQSTYNTYHRHLAFELRNGSKSKQSELTDTFSVGYLLKHTAITVPYEPLIEIGLQMKAISIDRRLSIAAALECI